MNILRRFLSALLAAAFCLPNPALALRPEPDLAGVEQALHPTGSPPAAGMEEVRMDMAEDATGGAELLLEIAKAGGKGLLINDETAPPLLLGYPWLVYNTQTRDLTGPQTSSRVPPQTRLKQLSPGEWSYLKIDSTLRGPWADLLLARAQQLQPDLTLVVPAIPSQGRLTQQGVHGLASPGGFVPLHETNYRNLIDPNLVRVGSHLPLYLSEKVSQQVPLVTTATIRRGREAVQEFLQGVPRGSLVVADAADATDLKTLAQAVKDLNRSTLCCGSAGFYSALVAKEKSPPLAQWSNALAASRKGRVNVLVLAGSHHEVSQAQVEEALRQFPDKVTRVAIPSVQLLSRRTRPKLTQKTQGEIAQAWEQGRSVIVQLNRPLVAPPGDPVRRHLERFYRALIEAKGPQERPLLVVFGGDTLDATLRAFRGGLTVMGEVAPQISYGQLVAENAPPIPLISKSGGFGTPDLLVSLLKEIGSLRKLKIGITLGDPAGSSPELLLLAIRDNPSLLEEADLLAIGDAQVLDLAKDFFGIRDPQGGPQIRPVARVEEARFQPGVLNVLDLHNVDPEVLRRSFGPRGAEDLSDADRRHLGGAALDYIRMGIELASTGQVDGLATLPVTKEDIALVEPGFRGHTEFLGERLGTLTGSGQVTIVLVHGNLRVLHVTMHIPLQEVGRRFADPAITPRILELIEIADRMGRQFYGLSRPRIGVLGLNPHAGEGGLMGTEDRERILPAIEEARSRGLRVEGPIPGDAAFVPGIRDQYDFLLAMYHDQGHAPFKAIAGHGAINFTGNLTVVRTTPDHGTARKLAWNLDRPFPLSTAGTIASIRSATQMTALQRKPPATGAEEDPYHGYDPAGVASDLLVKVAKEYPKNPKKYSRFLDTKGILNLSLYFVSALGMTLPSGTTLRRNDPLRTGINSRLSNAFQNRNDTLSRKTAWDVHILRAHKIRGITLEKASPHTVRNRGYSAEALAVKLLQAVVTHRLPSKAHPNPKQLILSDRAAGTLMGGRTVQSYLGTRHGLRASINRRVARMMKNTPLTYTLAPSSHPTEYAVQQIKRHNITAVIIKKNSAEPKSPYDAPQLARKIILRMATELPSNPSLRRFVKGRRMNLSYGFTGSMGGGFPQRLAFTKSFSLRDKLNAALAALFKNPPDHAVQHSIAILKQQGVDSVRIEPFSYQDPRTEHWVLARQILEALPIALQEEPSLLNGPVLALSFHTAGRKILKRAKVVDHFSQRQGLDKRTTRVMSKIFRETASNGTVAQKGSTEEAVQMLLDLGIKRVVIRKGEFRTAAGTEETQPQQLSRVARQMQAQGWIESAGRFRKEWASAWYMASENLRMAELFGETSDTALWESRLRSLSDFIRLLEALFTEEIPGNPLRVLNYTHFRGQTHYYARIRLETGGAPLTAFIEMNRHLDFPRLSVLIPGRGQFRIGRDADRSVVRPLIHLDIHDRTKTKWWSHRNMVPVWSNRNSSPLSSFSRFQEQLIDRIEQLAQRDLAAAGMEQVTSGRGDADSSGRAWPGFIGPIQLGQFLVPVLAAFTALYGLGDWPDSVTLERFTAILKEFPVESTQESPAGAELQGRFTFLLVAGRVAMTLWDEGALQPEMSARRMADAVLKRMADASLPSKPEDSPELVELKGIVQEGDHLLPVKLQKAMTYRTLEVLRAPSPTAGMEENRIQIFADPEIRNGRLVGRPIPDLVREQARSEILEWPPFKEAKTVGFAGIPTFDNHDRTSFSVFNHVYSTNLPFNPKRNMRLLVLSDQRTHTPQAAWDLRTQKLLYPFKGAFRIYLDPATRRGKLLGDPPLYRAVRELHPTFWDEEAVRQAKQVVFLDVPTFGYEGSLGFKLAPMDFYTAEPARPESPSHLLVIASPVTRTPQTAYDQKTGRKLYPPLQYHWTYLDPRIEEGKIVGNPPLYRAVRAVRATFWEEELVRKATVVAVTHVGTVENKGFAEFSLTDTTSYKTGIPFKRDPPMTLLVLADSATRRPQAAFREPMGQQIYPSRDQIRIYLDAKLRKGKFMGKPTLHRAVLAVAKELWKEEAVLRAGRVVFSNVPTALRHGWAGFSLGKNKQVPTTRRYDPERLLYLNIVVNPKTQRVIAAYDMETGENVSRLPGFRPPRPGTGRMPASSQSLHPAILRRAEGLTARLKKLGSQPDPGDIRSVFAEEYSPLFPLAHQEFDHLLDAALDGSGGASVDLEPLLPRLETVSLALALAEHASKEDRLSVFQIFSEAADRLNEARLVSSEAGMEEVVQALERLFDAAPRSLGPEVLVFTEPETFDLVPLAVRWGRKVAVLSDTPEAEALRELLESVPAQFPAGSYAVGILPVSRFLENYDRQIWVESEAHGLRLLRLPPELGDLPEPVAQLLRAVHQYLAIAVAA